MTFRSLVATLLALALLAAPAAFAQASEVPAGTSQTTTIVIGLIVLLLLVVLVILGTKKQE